jgi:hypothetical protein
MTNPPKSNTDVIVGSLREVEAKHAREMARLQDMALRFMSVDLKPIFKKYPKINAIGWNQYTPYFNDGEECEFEVHEPAVAWDTDEIDYYEEVNWYSTPGLRETYQRLLCEIRAVVNQWSDELKKSLFGDHVEIVFRRDPTSLLKLYLTHEVKPFRHE